MCLGEMASFLPMPGGHIRLANRFVNPALSFTLGWNYVCEFQIPLSNLIIGKSHRTHLKTSSLLPFPFRQLGHRSPSRIVRCFSLDFFLVRSQPCYLDLDSTGSHRRYQRHGSQGLRRDWILVLLSQGPLDRRIDHSILLDRRRCKSFRRSFGFPLLEKPWSSCSIRRHSWFSR